MEMGFFAPENWAQASELLAQYEDDAKVVAGGQSLMILLRQRVISPACLISVKGIGEGSYIRQGNSPALLAIGALTTHREVWESGLVRDSIPALAEVTAGIGSIQVQNWGTIGGSVAHADPSGDVVPLLMALSASVRLSSLTGDRGLPAEEFISGYLETDLAPNELLTEIIVPIPGQRTGVAYRKVSVRHGDMAIAGAAALVELAADLTTIERCVIVGSGLLGEKATRLTDLEKSLRGASIEDELDVRIDWKRNSIRPDPYVSNEYAKSLLQTTVEDVVAEASRRARVQR
ncbi:MAG: FAD binding domain-containing protein [Thermoleophilia bacterium]